MNKKCTNLVCNSLYHCPIIYLQDKAGQRDPHRGRQRLVGHLSPPVVSPFFCALEHHMGHKGRPAAHLDILSAQFFNVIFKLHFLQKTNTSQQVIIITLVS